MKKMKSVITLNFLFLTCWILTKAAQYQYELVQVNVFTYNTSYSLQSSPNNDLKYKEYYKSNITLSKKDSWLFSLAEEYLVVNATVAPEKKSCNFSVILINANQIQNEIAHRLYNDEILFEFNGIFTQSIQLSVSTESEIWYFLVYAKELKKPSYFDAPDSNEYSVYEASYFSNSTLGLAEIRNILNLTTADIQPISSKDVEFDVTPVAWFIVKLSSLKLVHQFIVMSSNNDGFNYINGIWLSFRLNENRNFILYKENNETVVFRSDYISSKWFCYSLLNPFIASEIRVHIDSGNPLMNFKMDFRFIEPAQYQYNKPIIGSFFFSKSEFLEITFKELTLVTGLLFNNVNQLLQFCIYYEVNGSYLPYKDSKLFNDTVIFTASHEIFIYPIRTKTLQFSCINWSATFAGNITISVKGSSYLTEDYFWSKENVEVVNNFAEYRSLVGHEKLYGDSPFMQKTSSLNRLMSSHFGPSCYTQPHLCDVGFTVQLNVAASFGSDDVTLHLRPSTTFLTGRGKVIEPELILFGSYEPEEVTTFFLFKDVMLPSNAEVTTFHFEIGYAHNSTECSACGYAHNSTECSACGYAHNSTECSACGDFKARAYLLVSQQSSFTAQFNNLTDEAFMSKLSNVDYMTFFFNKTKNNTSSYNSIDLLELFYNVSNKYLGLVKDLGIIIKPDDDQNKGNLFNFSRSGIVLTIAYRIKVIGDVKPLSPGSNSGILTLDEVYYITGMEVENNNASTRPFTLSVKYSDPLSSPDQYVDVEKHQMNGGEHQYIGLKSIIRAKVLKINPSDFNVKFYGSKYAGITAPIISAGVSGYENKTHGYGFQVHLNNKNKVVATVLTKDHVYVADLENPIKVPYTLTLVWSKQDDVLKLYHNGVLNSSGIAFDYVSSSHSVYNEYLLVFGDYHNKSDLRASLSDIKIWSIPLSADEISDLLNKSFSVDWNSLDVTLPSGFRFGSDCYCKNLVCPCETLAVNHVEYISWSPYVLSITEDEYFDEEVYELNVSDSTTYFDKIALDFQNVQLQHVYIEGKLESPKNASCSYLTISFLNSIEKSVTQWCYSVTSDNLFTTSDLLFSLSHLLKTVTYTRPLTIMVETNDVILQPGSILKIEYTLPKLSNFIQASASVQKPEDLLSSISLIVMGACLSFQFKFGGKGFVSLIVFGYKADQSKKELAFFYRQEALDKWLEIEIDLNDKGGNFLKVEFIALKNGLGSGYIAFGTFRFLTNCSPEVEKTYMSDLRNNSIRNSSDASVFYPSIFVKGAEVFTTFANPNISQDSNSLLLDFIHGHREAVFGKSFYFQELVLIKDFTLLFWFYSLSGLSGSNRVMNFVYGKEMFINFQGSSIFINYDGKEKSENIDSLNWHYVVVQYERLFSRLLLDIDFKARVTLDDIFLPTNSSMLVNLTNMIFCFQMFDEILFPSAIKAAQLCDNRPEFACTNQTSPCKWCNPFYGEWEMYPYRYIFDKNTSCIEDKDNFNKTLFQPFNSARNEIFVPGILNGYEVNLTSSVKMVPGFISNGMSVNEVNVAVDNGDLFKYTNSTFMFSIWIKQTCESWERYEPIVTIGLVALVCDKLKNNISTTVTPVMAFYNECLFALPGRSGLWYNFAFVFNESISFYIDGELISSECIPSKSLEVSNLLTDSNIYVSKVGSTATLVDEIFVGDIGPSVLFCRQLAGNISDVEKIKQMIEPLLFDFCSKDVWNYYDSLQGSYLYEKVVYDLELQLTTLLRSSINEFLHAEVSSIKKQSNQVCGVLNAYFTVQNQSVISRVCDLKDQFVTSLSARSTKTDELLEYYSRYASYNVSQINNTFAVLSVNLFEDINYPIRGILVQYNKVADNNKKNIWSNNAGFIFINSLECYTEYQVCFAFETFRRKPTPCIPQSKTFMTTEGVPVQSPILSCLLDQTQKVVKCNIIQITSSSWNGKPYSYNIVYRLKGDSDLCDTLESSSYQNNVTIQIYNASNNNNGLTISINTTIFKYKQLCIFAYATTKNGYGIGPWNLTVVRTQSEAPTNYPEGLNASFNETITFKWNLLKNTTEEWNDIAPGYYELHYGLVKRIPLELDSSKRVNIKEDQYVLNSASFCDLYAAEISAFSVAIGPKSPLICIISLPKKPDCVNPVIKKVYVSGPRSATIFHESVNPTHFRGNKYWLLHVTANANDSANGGANGVANGGASGVAVNAGGNTVEGYNPGSLSEEYLKQPIEFEHSLESFAANSAPCDEANISTYFNQSTGFELNLRGLHPYVSYQVSIQPCNEMGCGNISKSVSFQTYSDIPGCEPESLRLQNKSSTSMLVSWNKLNASCENGVLLDYILSCDGRRSEPVSSNYSSISASLQNLSKYELVCCRVAARNVNGTGPFSSEKCAYTDEDSMKMTFLIKFSFLH